MNVRYYRDKKNLTQKQVGEILGLSQKGFSKKERGDRKFTIDEALKLEEILGVSIYELFKELKKL